MKIVKEFVLRTMADEFILIPTGKTTEEFNGMISLSETAAYIWENLEKTDNFEALVSAITSEYEISQEIASADTEEFINKLLSLHIIEPTNPSQNW